MSYHLRGTSQYQNQKDKSSISVYGQSLLNYGVCVSDAISGVGLITKGFLWQGYEIWLWREDSDPVSTGWTAAAGYSGSATLVTTSWTSAAGYSGGVSLVTTAWTSPSGGMNGEFPA